MMTIQEVVEEIVSDSPFLEEVMYDRIINNSALTRKIKPEIEKRLLKRVKNGAILMALRRLSKKIRPKMNLLKILKLATDMTVRSNLAELVIANSNFSAREHKLLIDLNKGKKRYFMTITEGVFETVIITSNELYKKVKKIFKEKEIACTLNNLSSITIHLPVENVYTPGLYYYFLKILAWKGINIIEVISTYTEFTIIIENREIDKAFSLLKEALFARFI